MSESSPQCPLKVILKVQSLENYSFTNCDPWCFPGGLAVNNLPMQEMQIRSLGWEDSLEKEMATHSSILARKIPWIEEPDRLQSMELQRVRQD